MRPKKKPPRPTPASDWGESVSVLVSRDPFEKYIITKRVDKAPKSVPPKFLYGWVELPANFRVIEFDGRPLFLDATDKFYNELDGEFVEVHDEKQAARIACNAYNNVQSIMDS
jgi:hypothetical protein